MVKNAQKLQSFERELTKKGKADYKANLALVEAMHAEAITLGVFPPKNPISGIDADIRIAKAVNGVSKSS
jgi:hypothetical protein